MRDKLRVYENEEITILATYKKYAITNHRRNNVFVNINNQQHVIFLDSNLGNIINIDLSYIYLIFDVPIIYFGWILVCTQKVFTFCLST